jgi:hypothetical protein
MNELMSLRSLVQIGIYLKVSNRVTGNRFREVV